MIARFLVIIVAIIIIVSCCSYRIGISPVSKEDIPVTVEITDETGYLGIASLLKENGLIRSEIFYKIYVKIFNPSKLEAGTYILNKNMGVKGIIDYLEGNEAYFDTVNFTIPEGKHITDVADKIASVTSITSDELLAYWQSEKFIDESIEKYWFITDEVKNDKLRYHFEGYFFPATYTILVDEPKESITNKMLDKMDEVLSKYKDTIEKSEFTVHEILTLSSIVEHEAVLDKDRPMIAKVFLNRLSIGQNLQSCATIGYAINEWKLTYNDNDLKIDSPYNTYLYGGLPVGPGGLPSEASIKGVLYPSNHDYLYFLSNVYDANDKKTYYAKTYSEHRQNCRNYLGYDC